MAISLNSIAWLNDKHGNFVVGLGPFLDSPTCPPNQSAFYIQNYTLSDPNPWKIPSSIQVFSPTEWANHLAGAPKPTVSWQSPDANGFSSIFQEIMQSILSGAVEKTVPVVTEIGTSDIDPSPWIAAAMASPSPFLTSYGWFQDQHGFAGASPELLFSIDPYLTLSTMALAGTARSEDRDLFEIDSKEIREHEFVAQTLVSKLLELGSLTRHPRQILHLNSIIHFLTSIQVQLPHPIVFDQLIQRLHPTPALGPLPRTPDSMLQLVHWRNSLSCPSSFGAPFGLWHDQHFLSIVAIRGVWWHNHSIAIPSGCGIIEPSRLVNEWRELRLKRESVKKRVFP